jgi:hypothetical protein
MNRLFMITATCLLTGFFSSAQNARFGFTAGSVFANYTSKLDGETDNADSKTGITAGVFVDIPSGKHFSFQPALSFLQKGTKSEQTLGGATEKVSLNVNCIEVPLNFLYNAGSNTGNFFIGAGPSFAFALSGKTKYDDGTNSYSEDIKFGSNEDEDDLKGLDLGANFLTGYRFPNGLQISGHYNAGLSNLMVGTDSGTLKSSYFGVKVGLLLKGKKQTK